MTYISCLGDRYFLVIEDWLVVPVDDIRSFVNVNGKVMLHVRDREPFEITNGKAEAVRGLLQRNIVKKGDVPK